MTESWYQDIEFERMSRAKRAVKAALVNPFANYAPAGLLRALLKFGKSELAAANWKDPGGWRSMVISYEGRADKPADKILIAGGTIPMALRNRRRLAGRLLAHMIDACSHDGVHVLCLGAGPGYIITDALKLAGRKARATLVDLSPDAFEHGREHARKMGVADRVRFVVGDVRTDLAKALDQPPDIVKMMGLCEYLEDGQIVEIAAAVAAIMPPGKQIVFNSISRAHGTDRFFRRVFGLHMRHRSPAQLQELMRKAGFEKFDVHAEPLGVYHVVVGKRA